ncbi:MAG TPA: hypothetical protein PKE20_07885 [Promineifilum sp.]|nr:hypothetical protein [Promineifilum sp.]
MIENRRRHEALSVAQPATIEPITDARHRHALEKLNLGIERASSDPGYRAALDIFQHLSLGYAFDPEVVKIALPRIAAVTQALITGVASENQEAVGEWL